MITLLEAQRLKDAGYPQDENAAMMRFGEYDVELGHWCSDTVQPWYELLDKLEHAPTAPNSDELIVALQERWPKALMNVVITRARRISEREINFSNPDWIINLDEDTTFFAPTLCTALVDLYCKLAESQPNLDS